MNKICCFAISVLCKSDLLSTKVKTLYFIPASVPMLPQTGTTGGGPGGKSGGKASKQVPGKLFVKPFVM